MQEDIAIVKEEYPEADDVAILERLVEIGAHPMTISFQMERVQDSQGNAVLCQMTLRQERQNLEPLQTVIILYHCVNFNTN